AEVVVALRVGAGPDQTLTNGADYALSGATSLVNGGAVTLDPSVVPAAWPAGSKIILLRRTPKAQATALPDVEGHKPKATEAALDKAMRIAQEHEDGLGRALQAPPGETLADLPPAAARAGRFLSFDENGHLRTVERPEDFEGLNKANRDLANVAREASPLLTALAAGDANVLRVSGGAAAPAYVPDFNTFRDIPKSVIDLIPEADDAEADYAQDHVDLRILPKGQGKVHLGRSRVASQNFGWRDNATTQIILANPPDQIYKNIGWIDVQAEVIGAIPPNVVAVYPDFDDVAQFIRNYASAKTLLAVSSYSQLGLTLTDPAPDWVIEQMFLETTHAERYRAQVQGISADRRTLTVFSWYAEDDGAYGQVPPSDGSPVRVNPKDKLFLHNGVLELYDEVIVGGEVVIPRSQERIGMGYELDLVNNRDPLDYDGSLPSGVRGESHLENALIGFEVVDNGVYRSAAAFRGRGRSKYHFESRDVDEWAFIVLHGFIDGLEGGFRYEATAGKPISVAPYGQTETFELFLNGDMQIGSRSVPHELTTQMFYGAALPGYRFTLGLGNGDLFSSDVIHDAKTHAFRTGDQTVQFRVGAGYGADTFLEVVGTNSAGGTLRVVSADPDADINLAPKGSGVLNLSYAGANLVAASPGAFSAVRMIKVNSPVGPLWIPCMGAAW
ncbi:MAG: hypothetical protein ACK4Z5_05450, partial [Brevundimonas sp.]